MNTQIGKCVDITDKGTANGTALQLWTCYGTDNQKWSKSLSRTARTRPTRAAEPARLQERRPQYTRFPRGRGGATHDRNTDMDLDDGLGIRKLLDSTRKLQQDMARAQEELRALHTSRERRAAAR